MTLMVVPAPVIRAGEIWSYVEGSGRRTARCSDRRQGKGLILEKSRDEFLHRSNVTNYTRQLRAGPDASRRKVLMSLLAEEGARAKLHGWFPLLG